jgi:uncharacterized membrane protein YphA (DoxX/SURF4 family)
MSLLTKIKSWTDNHNPKWLALFRVALGAILLLRGVAFLNNLPELERMINENNLSEYRSLLRNALPWVHIAGGFLIIIGIFTRFAAFVQIPVLLAVVFFITNKNGVFAVETDLSFSILILLMLVVFVIEGSGTLSLAGYFKEEEEAEAENATTE